jgi:hypothetical protein
MISRDPLSNGRPKCVGNLSVVEHEVSSQREDYIESLHPRRERSFGHRYHSIHARTPSLVESPSVPDIEVPSVTRSPGRQASLLTLISSVH